jgi:hypothetical protein
MNQTLLRLEQRIELGPTFAARLIGIAYPTYAQYRSGRRKLQRYHERHIEALLCLSEPTLTRLVKAYAYGN